MRFLAILALPVAAPLLSGAVLHCAVIRRRKSATLFGLAVLVVCSPLAAEVTYPRGVTREHVSEYYELLRTTGYSDTLEGFPDGIDAAGLRQLGAAYDSHDYVARLAMFLTLAALEGELLPEAFIETVAAPQASRLSSAPERDDLDPVVTQDLRSAASRVAFRTRIRQMAPRARTSFRPAVPGVRPDRRR